MALRFNRPSGDTYIAGDPALPNTTVFQTDQANGLPISARKIDSPFNAIIDFLNQLDTDVTNVVAGILPGSNQLINANKVLITDGQAQPTYQWVLIDDAHMADKAVTFAKMDDGTVGAIIGYDANQRPIAIGPGNDGDILTSNGNGAPASFKPNTALSKAGGTMTGDLGLYSTNGGTNAFINGTGDGASYNTYNIALKGQQGLGLVNAANAVQGYYDFTNGILDLKGGFKKDGVEIGPPANKAEQEAGTANDRTVTPANQRFNDSAIKAMALIDWNGTLLFGNGVASTTQVNTGTYKVTLSFHFANLNYLVCVSARSRNTFDGATVNTCVYDILSTNEFYISIYRSDGALRNVPFSVMVGGRLA